LQVNRRYVQAMIDNAEACTTKWVNSYFERCQNELCGLQIELYFSISITCKSLYT